MLVPWLFQTQMIATCWGLAQAYWVLFNLIHYPQGEKNSLDLMTGEQALQLL